MSSIKRASALPMIHVSRVCGHTFCRVRTTGTTWQASPSAESLRRQTLRGGESFGNIRNISFNGGNRRGDFRDTLHGYRGLGNRPLPAAPCHRPGTPEEPYLVNGSARR